MTIDAAAAYIGVPKFFVPVLADYCPDLIIEGNVVMAKRESNGPVIFTLLAFMGDYNDRWVDERNWIID